MPRLRAEVMRDRCMGVAMCVHAAPSAFKLDASGLAEYRPDGEPDEDDLHEAADACPMSAIKLVRIEQ